MPDAIVIGAGAAGLAAAQALCDAGLRVDILEARHRIGGRIYTHHEPSLPAPIELGAEFVHGRPPQLQPILYAAGMRAVEVCGNHYCFENQALHPCGEVFSRLGELFEKMSGAPDQSFGQFIEHCGCDQKLAAWATAYVEGFNAAPKERISTESLVRERKAAAAIEGDRLFRVPIGYDSIARWLAHRVESSIHLQTIVTAIEWRRGKAEVFTKSGRFTAPCVLVTVPLGVLQSDAIRFSPEPRPQREAINRLAMGSVVRITMRFRERIWERRKDLPQLSFLHSLSDWMPTWWTSIPIDAPLITGWTAGPLVEQASDGIADRSVQTLARLLGMRIADVSNELESWHMHDWQADPFSCGAYSYAPVGSYDARRVLATPVEDTLYFAGEATSFEGYSGTVHGAVASGQRAANWILKKTHVLV